MGRPPEKPSVERVVACMDPASAATPVLQAAARLADEFHAPWYAVYVTPSHLDAGVSDPQRTLSTNIRTAEQLGASVVRVIADRPAAGLCAFVDREGATHVVFGRREPRSWWQRSMSSELCQALVGKTLVAIELEGR